MILPPPPPPPRLRPRGRLGAGRLLVLLLLLLLPAACPAFLLLLPWGSSVVAAREASWRRGHAGRPWMAAGDASTTGNSGGGGGGGSSSSTAGGDLGGEVGFGLSWRARDIYHAQPDFPVLFVATRNESYAREVERHFGGQGYFVRSTRTVTRLAKMVRSTRPEGILISDHLSAPHILSFLASLKDLPDLWLIPILIVHDGGPPPAQPSSSSSSSQGGGGGEDEDDDGRVDNGPRRPLRRRRQPGGEETEVAAAVDDGTGEESQGEQEQQQQHHRRRHLEMLRLGARAVLSPGTPCAEVQALVEGARATRQRVETMVDRLHGAILHMHQHRRRLLPSTVFLEGPPPEFTATEQEVLNMAARGMTDGQIAHSLGLTGAAVGNAMRSVVEKLGCDLRGEAVRAALDNDLVTE